MIQRNRFLRLCSLAGRYGIQYDNPIVPHADNDFIGPCRVQQRRRSRAQQKQQEIPGSTYPDHEVRPWRYLITPPQETGGRVLGATNPLSPFPPFRAAWAGTPSPPPQGIPLPQENYHLGPASVKTSLRPPNLESGSEVAVPAQDDRMEHFWQNGISLRGQTAEIQTSAG